MSEDRIISSQQAGINLNLPKKTYFIGKHTELEKLVGLLWVFVDCAVCHLHSIFLQREGI